MKIQFRSLFVIAGLLACLTCISSAQNTPITPSEPSDLAPMTGLDRETAIAMVRLSAEDPYFWLQVEYFEVAYPKANPDAYLSPLMFERLKETRRQALLEAALIFETYAPRPATSPSGMPSLLSRSGAGRPPIPAGDRRVVGNRADLRAAPLPHHRLDQLSGARPTPQHTANSRK